MAPKNVERKDTAQQRWRERVVVDVYGARGSGVSVKLKAGRGV